MLMILFKHSEINIIFIFLLRIELVTQFIRIMNKQKQRFNYQILKNLKICDITIANIKNY